MNVVGRRFFDSWYCDATPQGDFAVLVSGQHIVTNRGAVSLPNGQNLLFLRIAPDGVRFAGIGHRDDLCWEWDGTSWTSHGLAFGPRAVAYAPDGSLQIVRHAPAHGWRNWPVTAEQTYADPARQVWEYTDLSGLTIGQGGDGPHGDDPCIALLQGKRHLIEAGRCRAINVAEGDRVVVAYVREDTREAVIRWLTRSEIAALPIAQLKQTPKDTPKEDPKEPPKMDGITDAQFETLKRERAKYGERVSPVQIGAILNATAWAHRDELGLQEKPGGVSAIQPRTGISVWNGLWIKRGGKDYGQDVLHAATVGIATPVRGEVYIGQPDKFTFIPPVEPVGEKPKEDPKEDPKDPVTQIDVTAILARLDRMAATSEAAHARTEAHLRAVLDALSSLHAPPIVPPPVVQFPDYQSNRLALIGTITLKPVVKP